MSFWDNVKKFAQPYNEDEYDDYDEDEEYPQEYEEQEEQPAPRRATRAPRRAPAPAPEAAPEEKEEDDLFSGAPAVSTPSAPSSGFNGTVLNMSSSRASSSSNKQEVVLFRPNKFGDTLKAADDLKSHKALIVNMENVDTALARRVVDFLTGCVYALGGKVEKIAQNAYLFCPNNMDIIGNLESLQAEIESYM